MKPKIILKNKREIQISLHSAKVKYPIYGYIRGGVPFFDTPCMELGRGEAQQFAVAKKMLINWARKITGKRHGSGGAGKWYEYNDYQHRFYRSAALRYCVWVKDGVLHIPKIDNMIPATLQTTSKIIRNAIRTTEVWHPKMTAESAWSMNERVRANRLAWFAGKLRDMRIRGWH